MKIVLLQCEQRWIEPLDVPHLNFDAFLLRELHERLGLRCRVRHRFFDEDMDTSSHRLFSNRRVRARRRDDADGLYTSQQFINGRECLRAVFLCDSFRTRLINIGYANKICRFNFCIHFCVERAKMPYTDDANGKFFHVYCLSLLDKESSATL